MTSETWAQADARRIIASAWRIRKLTLWLEAVIGLPMMMVGLMLARREPESLLTFLFLLSPFTVAIPVIAYRLVTHRSRPRAVVLWVRRFHRGKRATVEQAFLEHAVVDWGQLITLCDTAVDTDSASRMMLTWQYCTIVAVFVGITSWIAKVDLSQLLGLLAGFICFLGLRYKKVRVNLAGDTCNLDKIVTGMHARRMPDAGSVVLRCPRDGDLWRQVIMDLSETVDAAIVSVAESSPYVDWEIQTLASRLGPDKMIILIDGAYPIPPLLKAAGIVNVPAKMRWWPSEQQWRSAAISLGSAILTSRR
jgi:hypothetical protein